jgi:hypothetical protein
MVSVKNDVPFWWDWRLELAPLVDRRKNGLESGGVFLLHTLDFPAQVLVQHDQSAQVHERSR